MDRDLKRSIILDNYQNPNMKHTSNEDYVKINTRNVSCIDNLDIYLKIENDIIKDVIVNCLENLKINRIIEKDKKQLEVRMQEQQIKNDKLGIIYKELINIVNSYPDRSPNDVLRNIEFAPSYSMEKFESVIEIQNIQIEDNKRQLNYEHLKRERRYDIENQISNREYAIKKINKIRDDYFFAEEKYRKFRKLYPAMKDLFR